MNQAVLNMRQEYETLSMIKQLQIMTWGIKLSITRSIKKLNRWD